MQGASWISLFRRIPGNLHDGLILSLSTGTEVVVQRFIKLDTDVVVLRGRMAGSQDAGRVVVLPYSHLVSINFVRRLTDTDLETVFGKNTQTFAADINLAPPPADGARDDLPDEPVEPAAQGPAGTNGGGAKPGLPSKAELLAKLRARLGDSKSG
jgi:hypothetical protein